MRHTFLACLGLVLVLATASTAGAPPRCGPRDAVVQRLADRYGEAPQSVGLAANNQIIEVFASDGGTWSVLLTRADGTTCLMASGTNFETLMRLPPGRPA